MNTIKMLKQAQADGLIAEHKITRLIAGLEKKLEDDRVYRLERMKKRG